MQADSDLPNTFLVTDSPILEEDDCFSISKSVSISSALPPRTAPQSSLASSQNTLSQPDHEENVEGFLDALLSNKQNFSQPMDSFSCLNAFALNAAPSDELPRNPIRSSRKKRKRMMSSSQKTTRKKRRVHPVEKTEPNPKIPEYIRSLTPAERAKMGDAKKWVGKKMMKYNHTYGNIGSMFQEYAFRTEMRTAGLHKSSMAGIDGVGRHPARCVVANSAGGYDNDEDSGDIMFYTGQGKVKAGDQTMTRYNLSLKKNMDEKIPLRVVRGPSLKSAFTPGANYRYDGLYWVVSYKQEIQEGRQVYVFKLVRLPGQQSIQALKDENYVPAKTKRTTTTTKKKSTDTDKKRKRKLRSLGVTTLGDPFDEETEQEEVPQLGDDDDDEAEDNRPQETSLWQEVFGEPEPPFLNGVGTNIKTQPQPLPKRRIPNQPLWQEPLIPPPTAQTSFDSVQPPHVLSAQGRLRAHNPVRLLESRTKVVAHQIALQNLKKLALSSFEEANLERLRIRVIMNQLNRRRALENA
eukprot:CAMPEP_0117447592 /NCGR_PEP_ID=MMETSP0759-20121206/6957_1 /TAXON_ID=63605 /ORGANISM="Percolomonas cosmopolitus, Strain WS" /LENGTH=520 /DNA_ID=CAMNT_0005239937 /DNA_START=294 /DNA_END=1853 /DNA_ORIENTATION=+